MGVKTSELYQNFAPGGQADVRSVEAIRVTSRTWKTKPQKGNDFG